LKCLSDLRTSIDKIMVRAAKEKRDGKGNPAQRDAKRAAHADAQSCLAAIQAAGGDGAELADARKAVHAAAQAEAGAYLPGQGEAARRAGASFYPFVMTAAGGLGKEARATLLRVDLSLGKARCMDFFIDHIRIHVRILLTSAHRSSCFSARRGSRSGILPH